MMNTENNQGVTKQDLKEATAEIIKYVDYKVESKVDSAVAGLKTFMMEGFTAMGAQMDHIEGRVDSVDDRLSSVEEHLDSIDKRVGRIENKMIPAMMSL